MTQTIEPQTFTLLGGPLHGETISIECWSSSNQFIPPEHVAVDIHTYESHETITKTSTCEYTELGYRYKCPEGKFWGLPIRFPVSEFNSICEEELISIGKFDFVGLIGRRNGDSEFWWESVRDWWELNLSYEPLVWCGDRRAIDKPSTLIRFRNVEDHLLFHIAFAQYSV